MHMPSFDLEHYCMFYHKEKRLTQIDLFSLTCMPLHDVSGTVIQYVSVKQDKILSHHYSLFVNDFTPKWFRLFRMRLS